jgi:putative colanic acid biosynthesis UDP-glucose lipid carrier transferase
MRKQQPFLKNAKYALDAFVLLLAYSWAVLLFKKGTLTSLSIIFYGVSCVLWYSMSLFSKLYTERRSNKFSEELVLVLYHAILFAVSLSSILFFSSLNGTYSSKFIITYVVIAAVLAIASKYFVRKQIHAALNKGSYYDNVLLIGSTLAAVEFIDTVNKYYYYGYKCVGYIDEEDTLAGKTVYFGNINTLKNILVSQSIDEVFIALPTSESNKIQKCINICDMNRVRVRMLPDLTEYTTSSVYINNIGLLPVVNVGHLPLDRAENKFLKRIFDIVFSSVFFLTIGVVLFPLIALVIKLTSKGPIFFKQERWGHNNKKITCYKFRSMVKDSSDTNEDGKYNQAFKDDPRITIIGGFLRKTNLDELPQFWNVLIGNMSVVGPRPHPIPLNLESMHTVDNYMLRHLVLPGITGLAQVNGCRGETKTTEEMQRRVNFDLYFIHRWNFWLDIQIIIQTIVNIVRGDQNAY